MPRRAPRARWWFGALFVAAGVPPILASLQIAPFAQGGGGPPPWVGIAAGAAFILAGLSLWAQAPWSDSPLPKALAFAVMVALAAIANWVAFGAGPRQCGGTWSLSILSGSGELSDLSCRVAFAWGAVMANGMLLVMAATLLEPGAASLARGLTRLGWAVLIAALAPLLVLMVAVLIVKSAPEAYANWRATRRSRP